MYDTVYTVATYDKVCMHCSYIVTHAVYTVATHSDTVYTVHIATHSDTVYTVATHGDIVYTVVHTKYIAIVSLV